MGHSQSRDTRVDLPSDEHTDSPRRLSQQQHGASSETSAEPHKEDKGDVGPHATGMSSHKRQRSSSLLQSTCHDEQDSEQSSEGHVFVTPSNSNFSRQRRRIETNESSSMSGGPSATLQAPLNCMEIDQPPSTDTQDCAPNHEPSTPSGTSHATTPAYRGDGTPPPHLDPLHEERERARRRILEALLASSGNATASATSDASPVDTTSASVPLPALSSTSTNLATDEPASASNPPVTPPITTDALAGLLGGIIAASAGADSADGVSGSQDPPLSSTTEAPGQTSQPTQGTRRAPLHPSALSGTSMIVQGALVARTIPNRRGTSEAPIHRPASSSHNTQRSSSTPTSSTLPSSAHAGSQPSSTNIRDSAGNIMPNDDEPRAVTLEEQAVMLSRILGIAAAATAASLVSTVGAERVDRALLQSSLQPPFTPLGQAGQSQDSSGTGNSRTMRSSTVGRSRSPSASTSSSSHRLGTGLRDRFAAITQRVRSASFSRGSRNSASHNASASTASASSAHQQEIIAQLLSAANREAQSRSNQSDSTSPTDVSGAQVNSTGLNSGHRRTRSDTSNSSSSENSGRSLLSRFMRETLGQFITPARPNRSDSSVNNTALPASSLESDARSAPSENDTTSPAGYSRGPNDVAGTLQQVRNGVLPDGVSGSFGSFLNHLLRDLMVAVQSIRPASQPLDQSDATTADYFEAASEHEATNGAELLDADEDLNSRSFRAQAAMLRPENVQNVQSAADSESAVDMETRLRRERDLHQGNLSFFRLFRFEPVAPSTLVPCIVVGVRSLDVTERIGEEMTGAQTATNAAEPGSFGTRQQTSQPTTLGTDPEQSSTSASADGTRSNGGSATEELSASRFLLFVSGGRYPANHPLLNSHPTTAGRDLMILMDLLGTMQAMQSKASTVTQQEIDSSELQKIRGDQVADLVSKGKITENMAERCLVCLEDWQSEEECRLMACRHVFHAQCVDRWLTASSNTCPMCRRQGVAKDGKQAGAETADSRAATQA